MRAISTSTQCRGHKQGFVMPEVKGWPRMLESVDCKHWMWKNRPATWHSQFTGHSKDLIIILEVVASKDLWIWHCYFGLPRSHNGTNVLQISHLFARLAGDTSLPCNFNVNGHQHDQCYYLVDGIYPSWPTFVKRG